MIEQKANDNCAGADKEIFILVKGSYSPTRCEDGENMEEEIIAFLGASVPPVKVESILVTYSLSEISNGIREI